MNKDWYKPYDSPEELYVSWYLDELEEAGYVERYLHQPKSLELSDKKTFPWEKVLKTKRKQMSSTLLQGHIYTPDFSVTWEESAEELFFKSIFFARNNVKGIMFANWPNDAFNFYSYIEVKPIFDRNNMTRLFTINQKWVYDKYGIYVQKIIPQKLFKDTFTPQRYLSTDSGKQKRKLNFAPRTLAEYIKVRGVRS